MTSEIDKIESSVIDPATANKEEPSELKPDNKSVLANALKDPEIMQLLIEAFKNSNNKSSNDDDDNRLEARKAFERNAEKQEEKRKRSDETHTWFKIQKEVESLPFSSDQKKQMVLKTLARTSEDVDNKGMPYSKACNLAKMAAIKEELDIQDDFYKCHTEYEAIKDLFTKSRVEDGIIVREDILNEVYRCVTSQMKTKETKRAAEETRKLSQYNQSNGFSYEIDYENLPLSKAINYVLHGANRYNKNHKNTTMDDYRKTSKVAQDKYLKFQAKNAQEILSI